MISEKVRVRGNFNGHVGSDMGGFGKAHGGFGIGQIDNGEIRLLDWPVGKGLCLTNTCFWNRKSWLITFRSDETETMIGYILVNNRYRSSVKDFKIISGEEVVSELTLPSVFGYGVKKEGQEESKI